MMKWIVAVRDHINPNHTTVSSAIRRAMTLIGCFNRPAIQPAHDSTLETQANR